MKILILGSAGLIGSALTKYLRNWFHDVEEFDIKDNPLQDLRQRGLMDAALRKADFCFFLAYDVGGSKYLTDKQNDYDFLQNNMKIMTYTFESLKRIGTPFIFASSQMSSINDSAYGTLKRIGEFYTTAIGGISARFWNVYGCEESGERSHVIADFIRMAKDEGCIKIECNPYNKRQFLYVDDCCEALTHLMINYDDFRDRMPIVDISSGEWTSLTTLATIILNEFGRGKLYIDANPFSPDREAEDPCNIIDTAEWKPSTSLRDGIKKILEQEK